MRPAARPEAPAPDAALAAVAIDDLALVERLSDGRVDLTFGSALDIFGGTGVRYADCVQWNRTHATAPS